MRSLLSFILFALLPLTASAQIVITEIMYDLSGTDSGREWIELQNGGASDIDLGSWKLFEQDTNHQLVPQGSSIIPSGGYAVIADNIDAFLSDHPAFSGVLFDSSFSLSNEGETLALKNGDSTEASVTYSGTWGAAGDGNSLQWDGSGWRAVAPTPGAAGDFSKTSSPSAETASDTETSETKSNSGPKKPRGPLSLHAGTDRTVTVGALEWFEAFVEAGDEPYQMRVHYTWNLGDGTVRVGKRVAHQYDHAGTYAVYVEASTYEGKLLIGRFKVIADEAQVAVTMADDGSLAVSNTGNRELDISGWALKTSAGRFVVPEHTFILPRASVTFSRARTGLSTVNVSEISLLHPDGSLAAQGGAHKGGRTIAAAPQPLSSSAASSPSEVTVMPEAPAPALAAAAGASESDLSLWLMALMGLLGAALLVIIMVRYNEESVSEASSYTIIDADAPKSSDKK